MNNRQLLDLFEGHYWDSFEQDKNIVLKHVRSVLTMAAGVNVADLDIPREKHRTDEQRKDIDRAWGLIWNVSDDHKLNSTEGHLAVVRAIRLGRRLALEEAAAYHDKAAADCEAIAAVNPDNEMGPDCTTHAADHRIAADDIRAMMAT